jgi:hypothetical protein
MVAAVYPGTKMQNGLYSVHIQMGDGVKGRASGVIVLCDGRIYGGDPYFWSVGSYTVRDGTWKGDLVTNQHTPYHDPTARPVFGGREVTTGFTGTFPRWNVRGVRHLAGGHPQHQFSRHLAPAG